MAESKTNKTDRPDPEVTRLVISASREGEADLYAGDRDARRFAVGMQLDVTTNPKIAGCSWPVTMHNVSEGGLAFWSKRQLRVGSPIWIREFSSENNKPWLAGEVTHCTNGIRGFLIGCKFNSPPAKTPPRD